MSFVNEVKTFVADNKELCQITLGAAIPAYIVGNLVGRIVTQYLGKKPNYAKQMQISNSDIPQDVLNIISNNMPAARFVKFKQVCPATQKCSANDNQKATIEKAKKILRKAACDDINFNEPNLLNQFKLHVTLRWKLIQAFYYLLIKTDFHKAEEAAMTITSEESAVAIDHTLTRNEILNCIYSVSKLDKVSGNDIWFVFEEGFCSLDVAKKMADRLFYDQGLNPAKRINSIRTQDIGDLYLRLGLEYVRRNQPLEAEACRLKSHKGNSNKELENELIEALFKYHLQNNELDLCKEYMWNTTETLDLFVEKRFYAFMDKACESDDIDLILEVLEKASKGSISNAWCGYAVMLRDKYLEKGDIEKANQLNQFTDELNPTSWKKGQVSYYLYIGDLKKAEEVAASMTNNRKAAMFGVYAAHDKAGNTKECRRIWDTYM